MMKRRFGMLGSRGFTLVEIMFVVASVGLLAVIGIPQFRKSRKATEKNVCLQNQRLIMDAATEYDFIYSETMEGAASDGDEIRDALLEGDFFRIKKVFECPSSRTEDFNDYTLEYTDGKLCGIVCQVFEDEHSLPR